MPCNKPPVRPSKNTRQGDLCFNRLPRLSTSRGARVRRPGPCLTTALTRRHQRKYHVHLGCQLGATEEGGRDRRSTDVPGAAQCACRPAHGVRQHGARPGEPAHDPPLVRGVRRPQPRIPRRGSGGRDASWQDCGTAADAADVDDGDPAARRHRRARRFPGRDHGRWPPDRAGRSGLHGDSRRQLRVRDRAVPTPRRTGDDAQRDRVDF